MLFAKERKEKLRRDSDFSPRDSKDAFQLARLLVSRLESFPKPRVALV